MQTNNNNLNLLLHLLSCCALCVQWVRLVAPRCAIMSHYQSAVVHTLESYSDRGQRGALYCSSQTFNQFAHFAQTSSLLCVYFCPLYILPCLQPLFCTNHGMKIGENHGWKRRGKSEPRAEPFDRAVTLTSCMGLKNVNKGGKRLCTIVHICASSYKVASNG